MLLFVFGFVLSILVPFIVFFMLRKMYQTIYGYSLYGRNYQLFSKHQMASIQNDNINSFWIFFTFFISILFGIYSFVNRGIVVPLLRLIFASTYPRSNSQGVLDIGYHLDDEHKALEMV